MLDSENREHLYPRNIHAIQYMYGTLTIVFSCVNLEFQALVYYT